ncbi:hypothetical protein ACGFYP_07475 [Streptomyces sp. NPDC048370]|uniref:hypothetical protein n=1 Tax=Streptomyces sp. NPDC048370 TaxID=3365540 RepID=UPI0037129E9D
MASRLNARLARLEQRSDDRPTGAQVDRVLELVTQVEDMGGEPLAIELHAQACPRGWAGHPPLRHPDTAPEAATLAWFVDVTSGRHKLPGLPPLCPLCSDTPAN